MRQFPTNHDDIEDFTSFFVKHYLFQNNTINFFWFCSMNWAILFVFLLKSLRKTFIAKLWICAHAYETHVFFFEIWKIWRLHAIQLCSLLCTWKMCFRCIFFRGILQFQITLKWTFLFRHNYPCVLVLFYGSIHYLCGFSAACWYAHKTMK